MHPWSIPNQNIQWLFQGSSTLCRQNPNFQIRKRAGSHSPHCPQHWELSAEIISNPSFNGSCGFFPLSPLVMPWYSHPKNSSHELWTRLALTAFRWLHHPQKPLFFVVVLSFQSTGAWTWKSGMGTKCYKFHITFQVIIQIHVIHLDCR